VIAKACPVDHSPLRVVADLLACAAGHTFAEVDGIPILLDPDAIPTQKGYWATEEEVYPAEELPQPVGDEVDEYVRWILRGTCGNLYDGSRIAHYPIPALPLAGGGSFLDVGSNWGRWTVAAARAGFQAVGIDPSLGAIRAARRVSRQLGVDLELVVADARHLPFPDTTFDVVFSYSVLQHLAPTAVEAVIAECARVLKPGGVALHQLPNSFGALGLYRQARRRFRTAAGFEVRYWRPRVLEELFERLIGPTTLTADAFLTLNPHADDLKELSAYAQAVVLSSRALTGLSRRIGPLVTVADSLWVHATRRVAPTP
jgi:SAM-dependent methyltransferase